MRIRLFVLFIAVICLNAMPGLARLEMKITFDRYNRTETLTNFPALVVFSNGMAGATFNFDTLLSTNGYDLRFWNDTLTTNLNYEIERWSTGSSSYVWVQIPSFTSNCHIWASWADSAQTNRPAYTTNGMTWEYGYKAVWHMNATNGMDSTSNRHNEAGVYNGMNLSVSGGQISDALQYANAGATSSYVSVSSHADYDITSNCTISVWGWPLSGSYAAGEYSAVLGNYRDISKGWVLSRRSTNTTIQFYHKTVWYDSGVPWPTATWSHVVFAKNGTNASFYLNGEYKSTITVSNNISSENNSLLLGAAGWDRVGANCWKGTLDELSLSAATRSSNWIWASYMSQASNSFFTAYSRTRDPGKVGMVICFR